MTRKQNKPTHFRPATVLINTDRITCISCKTIIIWASTYECMLRVSRSSAISQIDRDREWSWMHNLSFHHWGRFRTNGSKWWLHTHKCLFHWRNNWPDSNNRWLHVHVIPSYLRRKVRSKIINRRFHHGELLFHHRRSFRSNSSKRWFHFHNRKFLFHQRTETTNEIIN
jgi:hypothetical protein